jgi:hypothetical protein
MSSFPLGNPVEKKAGIFGRKIHESSLAPQGKAVALGAENKKPPDQKLAGRR